MSPEPVSSVFPDRLIHPLPKRRLRERLSPDVADSIKYPPAIDSTEPVFYYSYRANNNELSPVERAMSLNFDNHPVMASAAATAAAAAAIRLNADKDPETVAAAVLAASSAVNAAAARKGGQSSTPLFMNKGQSKAADDGAAAAPTAQRAVRLVSRPALPQLQHTLNPLSTGSEGGNRQKKAPSTASSVDGYDAFENTNNKKKRKIPTASDAPHSGGYSPVDPHSAISIASSTNATDGSSGGTSPSPTTHSGPASFVSGSQGISGPGRGRYGRARNGRSPLRPLSEAGNNLAGRPGKLHPPWPHEQRLDKTGIISDAIAKAEKSLWPGQENPGLLHQAVDPILESAQFTFTCGSQVPGSLTWPGADPKLTAEISHLSQGRLRGGSEHNYGSPLRDMNPDESVGSSAGASAGSPARKMSKKKKKGPSKLSRELDEQARARQRLQEEQNMINPPKDDSFYMCQFCEFEAINGYKPKYLIRSFEMRERKKRVEAERRQRLMEKAKARTRKGKKATRAAKTANAADQQHASHGDHVHDASHDGDGYDDDYGGGEGDPYDPENDDFDAPYVLPPGVRGGIGDSGGSDPRGRDEAVSCSCCNHARKVATAAAFAAQAAKTDTAATATSSTNNGISGRLPHR